jgi:hypothetical protein
MGGAQYGKGVGMEKRMNAGTKAEMKAGMKARTSAWRRAVFSAVVLTLAATALAKPAPWYRWSSKLSGQTVCSQHSPGDGWEKSGGPFRDARCEKRGVPTG